MLDIVGLGTIAMDVMVKVDKLPKEDGFCVIQEKTYVPGGSGTNVIVQASRLNAKCGYIAQVGDDKLGRDILISLQKENVDIDSMVIKHDGMSLNTQIVVDASGAKFILLDMGDCFLSMNSSQIKDKYIKDAKVFYTDLIPKEPAVSALKTAKESGLRTAFNMQVDLNSMNGFGISKEEILSCLQYVDLFAPCRDGLYQICQTNNLNECLKFVRKSFKGTLLITLGSEGSVCFDKNDKCYREPVCSEYEVIDTTGAGDSYMGAMLKFHLLDNLPLQKSMKLATRCAAITCSKMGARSGPYINEIKI